MLPLQQAFEVRQSIIEYLKATFGFKENMESDRPMDKYGWVKDYKWAWAHFELVFKAKG